VAAHTSGDLYAADLDNALVVRVSLDGTLTVVAGNGTRGFSGDGGKATNASLDLDFPTGLAVDSAGNLFIADSFNRRIRQVDLDGTIRTIAGNGTGGGSGDGGLATNASLEFPQGIALDAAGNLFIADRGSNRVRQVGLEGNIRPVAGNGTGGFSGDRGPAPNASLF
jgi:sugar lactone lactonase YvrE